MSGFRPPPSLSRIDLQDLEWEEIGGHGATVRRYSDWWRRTVQLVLGNTSPTQVVAACYASANLHVLKEFHPP